MRPIPSPPSDHPLRYAVWRAIALARDSDPLAGRVQRIVLAENPASPVPDVVLAGGSGEVLERITCRELDGILPLEEVKRFLSTLKPATAVEPRRFVSDARLLQTAPGTRLRDFGDPAQRNEILAARGLARRASTVIWDVGTHLSTMALTAESLVYLAHADAGDDRALYLYLYGLLAGTWRGGLDDPQAGVFPAPLLRDLYASAALRPEPTHPEAAAEGLDISLVRELITPCRRPTAPSTVSREKVAKVLRRGLFGETHVTLEDIYVSQKAMLAVPDEDTKQSLLFDGRVIDLMFRWLAEARSGRRKGHPLLVLGSFGCGKSSLLTEFAQALLQKEESIVPLLVPLRDLRGANSAQPLAAVLAEHVRREWKLDIEAVPPPGVCYCLLCDGFDELEIYYRAIDSERWVSECFRSLSLLTERERLYVAISSRPIRLMDLRQRSFEGSYCPNLHLELFRRLDIDQWCLNFHRAAGLPDFLDSGFLEERDLLEVARTPLVLYMLARLFALEDTALRERRRFTRAEIFRAFVNWTCSGGYIRDDMKHEVPSNYREILQEIGWFFYRTGDGIVPEGRLLEALHETFGDQAPNRVPIDRNILVAHMLQPVEAGAPGLLNPIEFTHQSFREYLVAERIWRLLGPVRLGEGPVAPSTWLYLCHKPLSTSEIEFLADLASELPWDEASALYLGLADTDNVHQYWTKWASPSWERLRAKLDLASVESARESANVAASRACNLATLGFLLRVKCFARLRTLAREEETELPKAPGAELLSRLLHLLLAFPETGVGGDNRALLLQNLQGLALEPRSLLDNLRLEAPCLRNALLRQVTFSGSHWSDADVQGADLTGARFEACRLHFANTGHAVFRDAVLTDAILTHPEGRPIRDADFSGADLGRARLIDVQMIDCRFARNRWLGAAHFRSSARSTAVLRGCELDDDAERFFSSQGFVLEQCRRI